MSISDITNENLNVLVDNAINAQKIIKHKLYKNLQPFKLHIIKSYYGDYNSIKNCINKNINIKNYND